jgi:hypothetical protein
MDVLEQAIQQDPAIQERMDLLERFTQEYVNENSSRELNGGVITIPTIVHVVYQNGTENITDNQIQRQAIRLLIFRGLQPTPRSSSA